MVLLSFRKIRNYILSHKFSLMNMLMGLILIDQALPARRYPLDMQDFLVSRGKSQGAGSGRFE